MKKICRNCHFLSKEYGEENRGRTFSLSWNESDRSEVAKGNLDFVENHQILKCHMGVWSKEYRREENRGRIFSVSLNESDRSEAAKGNLDFVENHYILKCHMGVWGDGVNQAKEDRNQVINKTGRKDKCFFFPYQPGMLFKAAEEFQKIEQNRQLKRLNICTRVGLWLVSIGLLVNAIIGILGFHE